MSTEAPLGGRADERPLASAAPALITAAAAVVGGLVLYGLAPMRGLAGLLVGTLAVALVMPLTVRRARAIRTSDQPIADAVATLSLLFTLLVLGFSVVYVVLARQEGELEGVATRIDALYFTLSTLATVGFGDAHAEGQVARVVVSVQIVFDLVFIATAVRLLTSVAQRRAAERHGLG